MTDRRADKIRRRLNVNASKKLSVRNHAVNVLTEMNVRSAAIVLIKIVTPNLRVKVVNAMKIVRHAVNAAIRLNAVKVVLNAMKVVPNAVTEPSVKIVTAVVKTVTALKIKVAIVATKMPPMLPKVSNRRKFNSNQLHSVFVQKRKFVLKPRPYIKLKLLVPLTLKFRQISRLKTLPAK